MNIDRIFLKTFIHLKCGIFNIMVLYIAKWMWSEEFWPTSVGVKAPGMHSSLPYAREWHRQGDIVDKLETAEVKMIT